MQVAEKFMFELSFDNEPEVPVEPDVDLELRVEEQEEEIIVPTFSEEELELARQQGFEAGKQEGLAATTETLTKQINGTLVQIDLKLETAFQTQAAVNDVLARSALSVAKGICAKMLPALAEKNSLNEVDRVISAVFARLVEHPSTTIAVHSTLCEAIEAHINELSIAKGYQGKIIVQADDTMQPSDCKVEWFNGGSERDSQAIWDDITTIVERNLGEDASLWDEISNDAPVSEEIQAETIVVSEPEVAIETEPQVVIETEPEVVIETELTQTLDEPSDEQSNDVQQPPNDD